MADMNKTNICTIGASIGQIADMDPIPDGIACTGFFRIKVSFDASLPLKVGFPLPRPHYPDARISFRYEKLSDFCYQCGQIDHTALIGVHPSQLSICSLLQLTRSRSSVSLKLTLNSTTSSTRI